MRADRDLAMTSYFIRRIRKKFVYATLHEEAKSWTAVGAISYRHVLEDMTLWRRGPTATFK